MAKREPWAPACSPFFLPVSSPSQEKVAHPARCSCQEPKKHFHSLHSATLNHLPVSPISSTFREAQTILQPYPASSRPPACPHNTVSEGSPIMLSNGITSLCTPLSALWALSVAKEACTARCSLALPLHLQSPTAVVTQALSPARTLPDTSHTHVHMHMHTHTPRHADIHRGQAHTQTQR